MSDEPPTPDNNLVLRNIQGLRREMLERQARTIDLVNRLALRVSELSMRMDKGFNDVQSDVVLMENKVLSAQSDVLRIVTRLDAERDTVEDTAPVP